MTRYSRAVIPGRPSDASSLTSELENLVADRGRANIANDEDEISEDEKIAFVERAASDRRAKDKDSRRKGSRRRVSDFAPLPGEAAHRVSDGGSKRGPLLLAGALVVVGVFGVVVWNAYREGVRPEDSAAAPVIAEEGAFKSKPAADTRVTPAEATVFEQVEARPSPAPAPEVRPEAPPPVAKVAEPAPAATAKPAESKPAPAPAKAAPTVAAAKPAAGVVGTTKPAALPVVGGAPKAVAVTTQSAAQTAVPAKPAQAPAKPLAEAPANAPIQLAGAAAATPAFNASGKFAVQIAAPATEAGAQAEWAKAAKKAPELFGSAERIIVQAEVNGKSVYRVRAGAFATAADADGFCNAFKAKGGACYRVAK